MVTHDQFIPKEYLPTFNSCTIEMFLWKIPGLTERFIYANDDFFAVNKLTISNLFDQDKILINSSVKTNNKTMYDHHCINCYNLIFGKLNNEKYLTFEHCFRPYFKSEMKQCFEMYKDQILNSITRFRSHKNYNCYLYLEDLVAKHKYDKAKLHILYCDSRNSTQNLHKMPNIDIACINDGQEINIYDDEILNTYFMHKFPNRSMFELTDYVYEKPVDINKYLQQPKKETKKDTRADGQSGAFLYF
ncbi:MAG: hypothetical protein J6Z11_05495 [Candidatus Riflebacteria bacterium]|nr:hypothetical protein [Candidatus Riflebacteria bacterium]